MGYMSNPICLTCGAETMWNRSASRDGDELAIYRCDRDRWEVATYMGTSEPAEPGAYAPGESSGLHYRCVICRDGVLRPVSEGRDLGTGTWACNSHYADPVTGRLMRESEARAAAELVRQYRDHRGPNPGDPFDFDVWAGEAAALLERLA